MKTLNKILCKATDFVFGMAEFIGMTVGLIVKWAILSALGLAAMVALAFLWLSVPYFACITLFTEITSQWQVFAMLGIFASWVVITKIALDWCDRRRNKAPLEKFFEEFNKRA